MLFDYFKAAKQLKICKFFKSHDSKKPVCHTYNAGSNFSFDYWVLIIKKGTIWGVVILNIFKL